MVGDFGDRVQNIGIHHRLLAHEHLGIGVADGFRGARHHAGTSPLPAFRTGRSLRPADRRTFIKV